MSNKELKS